MRVRVRVPAGRRSPLVHDVPSERAQGPCAVRLQDLLTGDVQEAVLFNYMFDLVWLLDTCPALATYRKVTLIHGERTREAEQQLRATATPNMSLHRPPLPLPYASVHSASRVRGGAALKGGDAHRTGARSAG